MLPLPYMYMHSHTSTTSLTAFCASPASYFVILRSAWLLHPAFLQDSKTPYILTYQVSNLQSLSSFPSTSRFSIVSESINPLIQIRTMAPATRSNNNSNSTKPAVASSTTSKSIVKNTLTNKPIELTSPSTVKNMILESGLNADASFVVPLKPATV